MNWLNVKQYPPPVNKVIRTIINDEKGPRNEQTLIFANNLWWFPDKSMYVYYNPTHWKDV